MKPKKLYYWIITIACCLLNLEIRAQSNPNYFIPNITPLSPNTYAFSMYGNYPVNLYTGLPDISIPLYTIESGSLKLPITLSYHASGIKISDMASWAGLGWSVNTGGSITRAVVDRPDETGLLSGELPSHTLDAKVDSDLDILYDVVNQGRDFRPDIFSYNIPGHSGSFFFNAKNRYKIEMIPFSPIAVNYHKDLSNNNALSFNVKDEHGNLYLLGQNYTEITDIIGGGTFGTIPATSAWMLEKMISQTRRDTISLTYTQATIVNPDCSYEICTIVDQPVQSRDSCGGLPVHGPLYTSYNNNPATSEQKLHTIFFKTGKVEFELNSALRSDIADTSLKDIKVFAYNFSTKTYEVQKTIKFYQSYFGTSLAHNQRLRLDSIQILDKAGAVVQHYRFGYNREVLPNYGSLSRDYWGYYNKTQDGVAFPDGHLIPALQVDYEPSPGVYSSPNYITIGSSVAHSRDPDSTHMQACMLDTIYYPTGGYTTFTYQTNRYLDTGNHVVLAGGLRIASINSYDGVTSTPVTKSYQYNDGTPIFQTAATQNNSVNYGFWSNTTTDRNWVCANNTPWGCLGAAVCYQTRNRTYYSQPTTSLDPLDGTPVGYTSVTEYNGSPVSNVGVTTYKYSFTPDQVQTASASGMLILQNNFFLRGQLTQKTESIHLPGGAYQVVRVDTNSYTAFPVKHYYNVGIPVGQLITNSGILGRAYYDQYSPNDANAFFYQPYEIQSDDNYLIKTITRTYDTNDPTKFVTLTVNYHYDNTLHQQVASITHNDSKGNTWINSTKYAYDYLPSGGSTTGNAVLDTMISRNMFAEPVEKWDSLQKPATSVNAVTGAQLNQYQFGSITGTVVPSKVSTLSLTGPTTGFAHSGIVSGSLSGDSRYVQMISLDSYDGQNNITQYTPRDATPVSILWDYQYEDPVAQVKNATLANVAYTGFEAGSKGGWTYSGTPANDIMAPAGSYSYPLGSGTISSSSLDNTKSYVLSYWSNAGAASVVYGSSITGTALRTANGWTYYEHLLPAIGYGAALYISGTVSVDELRLYPAAAQMTTYSYDPLGLRSTADTKGEVTYYEYDPAQRLKNVKDWNGNIVKNYGYHTYDQVIGNDSIPPTAFTRNNCPVNTTAGSASYSLSPNKYYASTKTAANAEANYVLQSRANAACACANSLRVTFTNSTVATYSVSFSGISGSYSIAASGTTVLNITPGTYATVTVNANDSNTHNYTMGTRTAQNGVHNASFSSVVIATGSSDLNISIN